MSDSDSFIAEVSEEVRRDRFYFLLRRWGWLAIVLVLFIVGWAAWSEYSRAEGDRVAQAQGDALLDGLDNDDAEARAAALMAIEDESGAVTRLLQAASQQEAGDIAGAAATLDALATDGDVPELYRDLAALKAAILPTGTDPATQLTTLEALAQPGAPFRLLALEQIAHVQVAQGDTDAALATLGRIMEDAEVTRGLNERAQTLIVALGGSIEPVTDGPATVATDE